MSDRRTEIAADLLAAMVSGLASTQVNSFSVGVFRDSLLGAPALAVRLTDNLLKALVASENTNE